MRKLFKVFTAIVLALSLTAFTACDVFEGFFNKPSGGNGGSNSSQTTPDDGNTYIYNITYILDGGTLSKEMNTYVAGKEYDLPTATKSHYTFAGWFKSSDFNGAAVTKISASDEGPKTFYAKWVADTFKVTLIVDGAEYSGSDNVTSYSYDAKKLLPQLSQSGFVFSGWFADSNYNGTEVTEIPVNSTGDKIYYGKFTSVSEFDLKSYGGYEEGAYLEFSALNGKNQADDYSVFYKLKSAAIGTYKQIDKQLVRIKNGVVRADVVGLKAGEYTIKAVVDSKQVERDVTVTAYDRSGYAHFKIDGSDFNGGIGGYNNDGTPKNDAYIIYVNEQTKNSVVAPWNSNKVGIVSILGDAKNAKKPVIVRVLGTIGAATWKEGLIYNKTTSNTVDGTKDGNLKASVIKGLNGKQLPSSSLTQEKLIEGGYNVLDTSVYSKLNGLVSKVSYTSNSDPEQCEYDSYWNNCEISNASNVTVEGIGTDAEIFQWGLTWKSCSSIEIRNITFDDYTEDACSFEGSTNTTYTGMAVDKFNSNRLWVHHNTFNEGKNYWDVCAEQDKREGDGATDFKRCAYVTIAYNHYYNNHKTGLIGSDDNVFTANVTFHHNFYDWCNSRLPLGRQANMHMYNNYYYKSSGTNMSLRSGAYALIEYCRFENAKNPIQTQLGKKEITLNGNKVKLDAYVKLYNCTFIEDELKEEYRLNTQAYNIVVAQTRADKVENQNIYDDQFDIDENKFYYRNGKSDVTDMITDMNKIATEIPKLAGVHKTAK